MIQIKVLLIEDQPVLRRGLSMLLASSGDVTAVGEVDSGDAAVDVLASCTADVLMLDLDLGGEDGFSLIPRLAEAAPGAKVLGFTVLRDPQRHRAALLAGARGVITKYQADEVVLKAIRRVASGDLWFERQLLDGTLTRLMSRNNARAPQLEQLTERETGIILLIGEGLRNAEIAKRLRISEKTVRNHLTSIFGKVGVSDRLELLVHAYQLGLVAIPRRTTSTTGKTPSTTG